MAYQNDGNVVYERNDLALTAQKETVRLAESIVFEVTNRSESDVTLGCHNPWALQRHENDEWVHVTWTAADYSNLCATILGSGETTTIEITLSEAMLEEQAAEVATTLQPGRHRLVLLGITPYLAVDFTVEESA